MWKKLKREVAEQRAVYILLFVILVGGFYLRVRGIETTLGFYFDQGRDANVIADLIENRKFFLIGPTTGIAGIFRGPFYYYLIAPFYWIGGGSPIWPSVFLSLTTVIAAGLAYYIGYKIVDRATGLFAAALTSFSFFIIVASRWLSNPTPMILLSMLLVWSMILVSEGKRWAWPLIAFIAGLSLFHFGSAGEFFYLFAIGIFVIWQKEKLDMRWAIYSLLAFLATALPLIVFDIRHENILSNNITAFLFSEGTFKSSFTGILNERLLLYYDVFTNKIFHPIGNMEKLLLTALAGVFLASLPKIIKIDGVKILLLLIVAPLIGLLFFQGNPVYDYYLTGYYLIFILLSAVALGMAWRSFMGKIFVIAFFYVFLSTNPTLANSRYSDGADGPNTILFGNQKQAIGWVYGDAKGQEFSVDVYVPPVIPHAYDYLFRWIGGAKYGYGPSGEQINPLYTLYEVDPPHPERLEEWLARQAGIGEIQETATFGGITVQRRSRIANPQ